MAAGDILPWASTSLLPARRDGAGGATYRGVLYVVGGSATGGGTVAEVRFAEIQNDGTIGAWTLTTALPSARLGCSVFVRNGFIYCVGGEDGGGVVVDTVFVAPINLDGTVGAWVATTALPAVRSRHVGYVHNGFAYVTGGVDALGDQQTTVYVAPLNVDGTVGAWTSTTALPVALLYHSGVISNDFIYVLGGITPGFVNSSAVYVAPINLDGTVGAWATTTALPAERWGHSSIVHGGFIYVVIGGAGESSILYAPLNVDGTVGAWTATADFGRSRAGAVSVWAPTPPGALPVVDTVFVFGGADESPTASRPTWSAPFAALPCRVDFVGSSVGPHGSGFDPITGAPSVTLAVPAGTINDDYMLAFILGTGTGVQMDVAFCAGWTLEGIFAGGGRDPSAPNWYTIDPVAYVAPFVAPNDPATMQCDSHGAGGRACDMPCFVFSRRASSEPASYVFDTVQESYPLFGAMVVYRNVDLATPISHLAAGGARAIFGAYLPDFGQPTADSIAVGALTLPDPGTLVFAALNYDHGPYTGIGSLTRRATQEPPAFGEAHSGLDVFEAACPIAGTGSHSVTPPAPGPQVVINLVLRSACPSAPSGPGGPVVEPELPGVYLDALSADPAPATRLQVINRDPEPGETGVPLASMVVLDITDTADSGTPSTAATRVYIDGVLAFDGGVFQSGWNGAASSAVNPQPETLRIKIDPTVNFTSLQVVHVRVVSDVAGGGAPIEVSYSFVCVDLTAPRVLSAQARGFKLVRLVFDEAVRQVSAAATDDALNPANYAFARRMTDPTVPAVNVVAVSVAVVDTRTVDITTDIELSQGQPYRVTARRIADLFGNAVAAPYDTADFTAFVHRLWPLYPKIPLINRNADTTHDLKKFIGVMEDMFGLLLAEIDLLQNEFDPDLAAEQMLDAMLADMANPFDFELSVPDKRRLIAVLLKIYKLKGTAVGVIDVVRFFMGIEITILALLSEGLVLGESELGVNWTLGPGTSWGRFAFEVTAPRTLTAEERTRMATIINYMKAGHEHLSRIIEPTPPDVIDHWELGLSELGITTDLH